MLDVRALLPGQSTFGRGAASCLVGPASPSPPARCSLAPQGGWAGGSGLRSEPSQVGMSQAGSPCVEVELARKEADSRGGKGHVRILTGVRRRRNTYVCCTLARTEAPGGAGEAGGGEKMMVLGFPDPQTTRTRSGGVPRPPGHGSRGQGRIKGLHSTRIV